MVMVISGCFLDLHEKRVPLLGEYNLPVKKLSRKSNRGGGDTLGYCRPMLRLR